MCLMLKMWHLILYTCKPVWCLGALELQKLAAFIVTLADGVYCIYFNHVGFTSIA